MSWPEAMQMTYDAERAVVRSYVCVCVGERERKRGMGMGALEGG